MIFKRVGQGRPYPDHGLGPRDWAALPPRPVRLDELVTTKDTLQLDLLLDEVHHSNMSKLDEYGRPVMRDDGKVMKLVATV